MSFTKESAIARAKKDLAQRLKIMESEIGTVSASEKEFSDMSLGAPAADEMAAQMISSGWSINLSAKGKKFDYRADKYQLRLRDYNGANHVIES